MRCGTEARKGSAGKDESPQVAGSNPACVKIVSLYGFEPVGAFPPLPRRAIYKGAGGAMSNLIEGIQKEQARCRELLKQYEAIPIRSGFFGITVIGASLERADKAIASGDVVEMLAAYKDLKDRE